MNLWDDTLFYNPKERPALSEEIDADVAIIGGGFTGLWSAYYLKSLDSTLRIVILEGERIGFGASGRNGGWCSALYPTTHGYDEVRPHLIESIDAIGAFAQSHAPEVGFVKSGTITVARNQAQLKRLHQSTSPHESFLSKGALLGRIGMKGALGALYTPDCAVIHPGRLVRALAEYVEKLGVIIYENTRALTIEPNRVRTSNASVRATSIIKATEVFSQNPRSHAPIYSLMVATEPLTDEIWSEIGLAHRETFSEALHLVNYGQRTIDNRLAVGGRGARYLFGSRLRAKHEMEYRVHQEIIELVREWFPALKRTKFPHRWGGAVSIPRDWHPYINWDRASGIARAGGYSGDGVTLSHLAGKTLAHLILEREHPITALPHVNWRNPLWEREPLRWLGVNGSVLATDLADREEELTRRPSLIAKTLNSFIRV
jgi:glycine/D-amino acid oxidase-like deaminating enzyme